jgi:hypothetical protein
LKIWLKKLAKKVYENRRDLLSEVGYALFTVALCVGAFQFRGWIADRDLAVWKAIATTPEPELCTICDNHAYHAPCIIKLSTGQLGEMQIYDNDPGYPGKLAEEQTLDEGVFYPIANGATISRAAELRQSVAHVEKNYEQIDPGYFCFDCRVRLASKAVEGFILIDMLKPDDFVAYEIKDGAEYDVRDYTVTITDSDQFDGYEIVANGHLWFGE